MKLFIRRNLGKGLPDYFEGQTITLDESKPDDAKLAESLVSMNLADRVEEPIKAKSK